MFIPISSVGIVSHISYWQRVVFMLRHIQWAKMLLCPGESESFLHSNHSRNVCSLQAELMKSAWNQIDELELADENMEVIIYMSNSILVNSIALAGVVQWIECGLWTKGSLVRFPVRAHAWVAGQVPSRGRMRGNQTLMILSLSLSLKINK